MYRVLVTLCSVVSPLLTQDSGAELEGVGQRDPVSTARAAAEVAVQEGRLEDAGRHLERALLHAPLDADLVAGILETLVGEELATDDARFLWTCFWYELACGDDGRASPPASLRRHLATSSWPAALTKARVEALGELRRFASERDQSASKKPAERLVADWARRLALDLARPVAHADESLRKELSPLLEAGTREHRPVIAALERLLKSALARGDTAISMRAARSLHGLAVQADFKDLKGPRPTGMGSVRAKAGAALARARGQQREQSPEPWSVEDLEWLTSVEGEAFTRSHDSFAYPGTALSPQEWYRVETDCGFETLLGVATTIELHHQRLAGWYGEDPFMGRPGIVRIVPEPNGLEAEGAPFWWAGGFQGGDTTVMRFAQGNIEGLGHGLTHELTHRFDGALFPGQPSWLTEGKAVWTGSAFGPSTDETFVANHANFNTIQGVWIDGWGQAEKLETLISGTMEDYRDNYAAGYCLYVYLNTWEQDGVRLFQSALRDFMLGGRSRRAEPLDYFEQHFCDAEEGRPEDFETFAEGYEVFLRGFWWKDRAEWTRRYTQSTPRTPSQPFVYDEPTWTWQRNRAEPFFGQDQARVAARVLLDAGKDKDALRALLWSLGVDGREPRCLRWLAEILPGLGADDAAWVAQQALVFPVWSMDAPAPFLRRLPKTRALLKALAQACEEQAQQGLRWSAAALAADHDRLALWTGSGRLSRTISSLDGLRHPFDRPAQLLGARGWIEDELVGYDKKRQVGLWQALPDGDLLVGRRQKRLGTGKVDRSGGGMAFTRSEDYLLPGTYRIGTRVRFTTAYGRGQVVFGYQRRDRSLRLTFSGGAYQFAVGESDEEPAFEEIAWSLSGMWERDAALSGSTRSGTIDFGKQRTAFDLSLLVDGAAVQAFVDGRLVATYHTADGRPIEGHVGFATSSGAFQFSTPRVQRLDRSRQAAVEGLLAAGLHLDKASSPAFEDMENRPVYGLQPSTNGSLLLWIPTPWTQSGKPADVESISRRARDSAERLSAALAREGATQPVAIALPETMGLEPLRALGDELADLFTPRARLIVHPYSAAPPPGLTDAVDLNKRWIFFVDAAGVARVVAPLFSVEGGFDGRLDHWLTVFRDHGRPPRELPEVVRFSETEDEDQEGD